MNREYYDANKNMRNYLKSKGFRYDKIQINEYIWTFRFKWSESLDEALAEYSKRRND